MVKIVDFSTKLMISAIFSLSSICRLGTTITLLFTAYFIQQHINCTKTTVVFLISISKK